MLTLMRHSTSVMIVPSISVVHLDDDAGSVEMLRQLLQAHQEVLYIRGFTDVQEAHHFLQNSEAPDVLFLDVEMPGKDGFDFAREISGMRTEIVFVTSHAEYAVRAFEACALDYIVKPTTPEKLEQFLERYRQRRARREATTIPAQITELMENFFSGKKPPTRLFISAQGKIQVVNLSEVLYMSSVESYTWIYMANGIKHLSTKVLRTYSDALIAHPDFVRIHRSTLINKQYVDHIIRDGTNHRFATVMVNGEELPISYNKREEIIARITDS